ncbi:MAG: ATP-binding protein [Oscillospiraceae bacterium]|nr:ATP-binding protein [Oscillospiraceae bacterium]
MGLLIVIIMLLMAFLWGFAFAGQFSSQLTTGMRTLRVTIIDEAGNVTFDNMADPAEMDNHLDRPEVAEALQKGFGESKRYSETLGETTRYYATRLADGSVLRLAITTHSASRFLTRFIPVFLLCLALAACLAFIAARRLTRRITAPINNINLDAPELTEYEELLPLMKKIAEQKREIAAQITALQGRADTIEAITGSMREGLVLVDETGIVLAANQSALNIFGESNMAQRNILHICRDLEFQQGVKSCLSGANAELDFARGSRMYNVFFSPGVILFFDVTERYDLEKQRRTFSANVSHELKTPLTTITALSEMIENGMIKEEDVQGFAGKISKQAKRLLAIIEDIIRLSEFDEGKTAKEYSSFDLYALAESIVEALRTKADEKHVAVSIAGEHLQITANRQMIDELLYNLIDNAIKYNRENGSVTIALRHEDGFTKIAVSDTGIGIPAEHQGRVFERFYMVDKSRSKATGGTGLGLSIVKHITEHHGGRVELESTEGEGTTVVCYI